MAKKNQESINREIKVWPFLICSAVLMKDEIERGRRMMNYANLGGEKPGMENHLEL